MVPGGGMTRDPTEPSPEASPEPLFDEPHPHGESAEGTSARVRRFARRLMDRRELAEDTRVLLTAVVNSSDKAKTEAVRMVAREVRTYLSELRLKEDLLELARSHSLEISISLKPLVPDDPSEEEQNPGKKDG